MTFTSGRRRRLGPMPGTGRTAWVRVRASTADTNARSSSAVKSAQETAVAGRGDDPARHSIEPEARDERTAVKLQRRASPGALNPQQRAHAVRRRADPAAAGERIRGGAGDAHWVTSINRARSMK